MASPRVQQEPIPNQPLNIAFSIDFDGVINNKRLRDFLLERDKPARGTYIPDPLPANKIDEVNPELIDKIVTSVGAARAQKLAVFVGSNRQCKSIDDQNSENKTRGQGRKAQSGSCFPAYKRFSDILKNRLNNVECSLNGFLLADAYSDLQPGTYMQSLFDKVEDENMHHRNNDPVKDESKITLLHGQTHYLAAHEPNKNHEFHFIDDLDDRIIIRLRDFYSHNPQLLPANVKLVLHHWTVDSGWQDFPPIQGTGPIDYVYQESLHWIADNCLANEFAGNRNRTEEQKYNRNKPGIYDIRPWEHLNVRQFLDYRNSPEYKARCEHNIQYLFSQTVRDAKNVSTEMTDAVVALANKMQEHVYTLDTDEEKTKYINDIVKPTIVKTNNFANVLIQPLTKQEKIQAARNYEDSLKTSTFCWRVFARTLATVIGAGIGFVLGVVGGAVIAGGIGALATGPGGIVSAVAGAAVGGKVGAAVGAAAGAAVLGGTSLGAGAGFGLSLFATRNKEFDNQIDAVSRAGRNRIKQEDLARRRGEENRQLLANYR